MDDDGAGLDLDDVLFARDDEQDVDTWDFGAPDPDAGNPPDRRRTALIGLAGVLVLVAVVITLVSVLVDTTPGAPVSPRTTAQAWAGAVVGGNDDHRRNLECSGGSQSGSLVAQVVAVASSATAGPARRTGPGRWSVPVSFGAPDGGQEASVAVTVIRQGRRYVVC